jgi:group I intron endonuclease
VPIVYVITNNINGKVYVGQTIRTFKQRLKQHKDLKHSHNLLASALVKYGIDSFSHFENEVPRELCDNFERNLIELYNSRTPHGYNLEGGGRSHWVVSPETRAKISKAQIGKKRNPQWRKNISEGLKKSRKNKVPRGKPSPETIDKIRKAHIGKKLSDSHKKKLSDAHLGKPMHPNTRQAILKAITGRKRKWNKDQYGLTF